MHVVCYSVVMGGEESRISGCATQLALIVLVATPIAFLYVMPYGQLMEGKMAVVFAQHD